MKINVDSDDELLLNKTAKIPIATISVRAFYHKDHKYYQEVFVGECLCKIQDDML